jgi:choline dehydrogenase-like flavoprotein
VTDPTRNHPQVKGKIVTSTKQNNVTDVLVIGSGMGGAAMSKRLSDAGIKVMCLEQGDWVRLGPPDAVPAFP